VSRVTQHCPNCGSDDICADAAARWDVDAQDWVLTHVMDEVTCQACDYEFYACNATKKEI
jgi:hypothetical protein